MLARCSGVKAAMAAASAFLSAADSVAINMPAWIKAKTAVAYSALGRRCLASSARMRGSASSSRARAPLAIVHRHRPVPCFGQRHWTLPPPPSCGPAMQVSGGISADPPQLPPMRSPARHRVHSPHSSGLPLCLAARASAGLHHLHGRADQGRHFGHVARHDERGGGI